MIFRSAYEVYAKVLTLIGKLQTFNCDPHWKMCFWWVLYTSNNFHYIHCWRRPRQVFATDYKKLFWCFQYFTFIMHNKFG